MAPHVNFWLVARGINIGLSTRMYFADEEEANAADPVLRMLEPEQRRATLVAPRVVRGWGRGLHVRHPPPGHGGNGLLRYLRTRRRPSSGLTGDGMAPIAPVALAPLRRVQLSAESRQFSVHVPLWNGFKGLN